MPFKKDLTKQRYLASPALNDAFMDFILSRQGLGCTKSTIEWYKKLPFRFLLWCENEQSITNPNDISARHVRQFLAMLREESRADRTIHAYARTIRTTLGFFYKEKYMSEKVVFEMPRVGKKRLPILDAEQLKTLLKACSIRERAIVMFMADTGVRRQEAINLNWGDVNMDTGLVRIIQGKGKKDRATVVGAVARRALLAYKRTVPHGEKDPLIQTRIKGQRFQTGTGLLLVYRRLSERTGIHVTPHAMRRTFVILSLRNGMDAGHIQTMMGHVTLDMVYMYAQMVDDDLIQEHKGHSPIDNLD